MDLSGIFCRCCLGATFEVKPQDYSYLDNRKVYTDMLLNTLNIMLKPEYGNMYFCEKCVQSLREATSFKEQILECETYLQKCYDKIKVDDQMKVANVKNEDMNVQEDSTEGEGGTDIDSKHTFGSGEMKNFGDKATTPQSKTPTSELKMRQNTIKLVTNSNMLLFKSLKIKYKCFYCANVFFKIGELRQHSEELHTDVTEIKKIINRSSSYKNIEITNLKCKLCDISIDSLELLERHLTQNHDVQFEPEGSHLVPFKIVDEFKCCKCEKRFNTFLKLAIHMHCHYRNNVCERCGASFINKASFRFHAKSHVPIKCDVCHVTFDCQTTARKHKIKVHEQEKDYKRHCQYCGKTFKYAYKLQEHRVTEHGVSREIVPCGFCDKVFNSHGGLATHTRGVHLKERRFTCDICDVGFFTKYDKKRHMITHDKEREIISCSYCTSNFKSKDSLRRHVRSQHCDGD